MRTVAAAPSHLVPTDDLLDDADVARRKARGEFVSLKELGPTPVNNIAVAQMRARLRERLAKPAKGD